MPLLVDDALISMRYSQRLLQGHGLTWTAGIPVEGYSNLLWVLLTAALGALGMDLVTAVRVLGVVGNGAVIGAIAFCRPAARWSDAAPLLFGVAAWVLAQPIAVYSIAGLEQPLLAGLLAWALVLLFPVLEGDHTCPRKLIPSGILLGLVCITRPDGPIFTVTSFAALLLIRGIRVQTIRLGIYLVAVPIAFYVGQLVFRLFYYGDFVPNTARVKVTPSGHHLLGGLQYLYTGVLSFSPLSWLTIAFAGLTAIGWPARLKERRARVVPVALAGLAWAAYIVFIGGDIFPSYRHFVPLIVVQTLLFTEFVAALPVGPWLARTKATTAIPVLAGALVLTFLPYWYMQERDIENERSLDEIWEWDGQVVGLALKKGFGDREPLLAVDAAGTTPYWSEFPTIDMMGLSDHHIARTRPEDLGTGRIGHELGDGQYVLDREPDLVTFGHLWFREARERSGKEMVEDPRFYNDYQWVRFVGDDPHTYEFGMWVRRFSTKIGIRVENDTTTIPAYLMNGLPATIARLDDDNTFVVDFSWSEPARIEYLALPPGNQTITVDASCPVRVWVERAHGEEVLLDSTDDFQFSLPGEDIQFVHINMTPVDDVECVLREVIIQTTP